MDEPQRKPEDRVFFSGPWSRRERVCLLRAAARVDSRPVTETPLAWVAVCTPLLGESLYVAHRLADASVFQAGSAEELARQIERAAAIEEPRRGR